MACGQLYSIVHGSCGDMSCRTSELVLQTGHRSSLITALSGLRRWVSFPEAGDACCTFASPAVAEPD